MGTLEQGRPVYLFERFWSERSWSGQLRFSYRTFLWFLGKFLINRQIFRLCVDFAAQRLYVCLYDKMDFKMNRDSKWYVDVIMPFYACFANPSQGRAPANLMSVARGVLRPNLNNYLDVSTLWLLFRIGYRYIYTRVRLFCYFMPFSWLLIESQLSKENTRFSCQICIKILLSPLLLIHFTILISFLLLADVMN